jgi:FAD/FMN-containing dehydrogenase
MVTQCVDVQISAGELQARVKGDVLDPCHPRYDDARRAWNLVMDQYPALVLMAESAEDIVEAVRFAREAGLGVAVQATGHGVRRLADDALLINTSEMTGTSVDPERRTAYVDAGATWRPVLNEAQAHGLAPLLGSSPDLGAVGYTLGGGYGWLGRKHGLSADSVRAFDVVLADGSLVRASQDENSDLFWGLRGGGGSLGIVAGMEVRLYPVTTVYGGNLFYPLEHAPEVFARYRDWVATMPEEMTSSVALMNVPPLPDMPELLRGQSFVVVSGCHSGTLEDGEALVRPWREWQMPVLDMFRRLPFSEVEHISSDPVDPVPVSVSGAWLDDLSDETAETLIRFTAPSGGPPPLLFLEVRHAGGAMQRVGAEASAYSVRDASFLMETVAIVPSPEVGALVAGHLAALKEALGSHLTGQVYNNFLEGEEARRLIAQGYSEEAYTRLRLLKAVYDPDNLFRYGYNIEPFREDETP